MIRGWWCLSYFVLRVTDFTILASSQWLLTMSITDPVILYCPCLWCCSVLWQWVGFFECSESVQYFLFCLFTAVLYCHWRSYYKGARVAQWVRSLDLTAHTSLSPIRRGFGPSFVNYKKECTRLAATSDNVYQLLAQGRWFSSGTPASSTTKTGLHDIAEILLKVALNTKNQIKSILL